MRHALLGLLLLAFPACRQDDDVTRGEGGELQLGREEARAVTERAVRLGTRTLVFDSETGSVTVVGTDADEARLRITRVARGATVASAEARLEQLTVEEAGDDELYQYVLRCNGVEGARIDVVAEVPRRARLRIALERGEVRLSGTAGDLSVENQLGSVEAAGLAGREVSVQTELGSVEAAFAEIPPDGEVRVETENGSVALTLPPEASAEVEVKTQTGTISVEGLTFTDRDLSPAGNRFRGRLGRGEAEVRVETEVGSITLREGRVLALDDLPTFVQRAPAGEPAAGVPTEPPGSSEPPTER